MVYVSLALSCDIVLSIESAEDARAMRDLSAARTVRCSPAGGDDRSHDSTFVVADVAVFLSRYLLRFVDRLDPRRFRFAGFAFMSGGKGTSPT